MSYPHLPPGQQKPRIRLHPFNREIWICRIVGKKGEVMRGDMCGVGFSPIEAYQRWQRNNRRAA